MLNLGLFGRKVHIKCCEILMLVAALKISRHSKYKFFFLKIFSVCIHPNAFCVLKCPVRSHVCSCLNADLSTMYAYRVLLRMPLWSTGQDCRTILLRLLSFVDRRTNLFYAMNRALDKREYLVISRCNFC